ncbi:MAG: hypothetical protein VX738_08130 [Planctomycetota bacterium]|nr:hypothetical protein [Planctomycetota bacterium]
MQKLTTLRRGLKKARRYRSVARVGRACAWWFSFLAWSFLILFGLDVLTEMGNLERLLLLVAAGAILGWQGWRVVLPAVARREDLVSVATKIQRHHNIPSDLVASLQFTDVRRSQYGSEKLRELVVETSSSLSEKLDYLAGFSRPELWKSCAVAVLSLALVVTPAVTSPTHFRTFLNRLLLQDTRYPTTTDILGVRIEGESVVHGRPVTFVVNVDLDKIVPENGTLEISNEVGSVSVLDLLPGESPGEYTVTLERAIEDFSAIAYLGDDESAPQHISVLQVPRPVVHMNVITPPYAAAAFKDQSTSSRNQRVLQGSDVHPHVESDKPLKSASLTIGEENYDLVNADGKWVMPVEMHPLMNIQSTTRYQIDVVDQDNISPDRKITGIIQVRPDQKPRIAAATVINLILSNAAPRIKFRAVDDFGLDNVAASIDIIRSGVNEAEEDKMVTIHRFTPPVKTVADTVAIELEDFGLEVGDTVQVTLTTTDFRGSLDGVTAEAEMIELLVTSRAEFLAAMREIDSQTDEKLDRIIKAQLGIGDRQ